jgi:hypothetical protein
MEQRVHQQDSLVMTAYLSTDLYPTKCTYLGFMD